MIQINQLMYGLIILEMLISLAFIFKQGIEDYLGDMDFKLAGTNKGITALQVLCLLLTPCLLSLMISAATLNQFTIKDITASWTCQRLIFVPQYYSYSLSVNIVFFHLSIYPPG